MEVKTEREVEKTGEELKKDKERWRQGQIQEPYKVGAGIFFSSFIIF